MENYGYIYKFELNNKFYIGKHKYSGNDLDENYWGSGILWDKALKKYGKENVKREILEWCLDKESLNSREKYWIDFYNSRNRDIGYNISFGGDGGDIYNSLSIDEKIRSSNRRHKYWVDNPDEKEKFKITIHNSLLNHKVSDVTRKHMSESRKKYWDENYDLEVARMSDYLHTKDVYLKIGAKNKEIWENKSDDEKNIIRENARNRWNDPIYRDKQHETRKSDKYLEKMKNCHSNKGQKFIYNKEKDECMMVFVDELDYYLNNGYILGQRPRTDEQKNNYRIAALNRKSSKYEKEGD